MNHYNQYFEQHISLKDYLNDFSIMIQLSALSCDEVVKQRVTNLYPEPQLKQIMIKR